MLEAPLSPGVVHQNSAHGLRSGGEEMPPAIPTLAFVHIDEPEVSFMNQSGGLESLAGLFLSHFLACQFPQLVVNQRKELLGGV
jgi:hypothetical protein